MSTGVLEGIHTLAIPTPFAAGSVNAYLLEGEPLTLVDCGPNAGTSLIALESGLEDLGHSIDAIEFILVTHQHLDHLGLASAIAARSGARIGCLDLLADYARDFCRAYDEDVDFAAGVIETHGAGTSTAFAVRELMHAVRGWGTPFETSDPLSHDHLLQVGDREVRSLHRPGHSPSDTIFFDERRGIAFGGDHLLRSPSVGMIARSLQRCGAAERLKALSFYIASLQATRDLALEVVLPGHGAPIGEVKSTIDRHLAYYEARADQVLNQLRIAPRSAYTVALGLWGDAAQAHPYHAMCDAIGHLDLLAERGLVHEVERNGRVIFERL